MRPAAGTSGKYPRDYEYLRVTLDLSTGDRRSEWIRCTDVEDFLGGIGRGFKYFLKHRTSDPYAPEAHILINTGLLSGSPVMTGLRTYIHGYSPLKRTRAGAPMPMWSAGSGKFGVHFKGTGIDDLVIFGRARRPSLLLIRAGNPPALELVPADDLRGLSVNEKIFRLAERYPGAHFAVIGPAGEHYETCWFAGVALSTERMLQLRQPRTRWCGRGGFGGVLGSKNLLAIVAQAPAPDMTVRDAGLKRVNHEIATGPGSRKFRDPDRWDGVGGTWSNYVPLQEVHAVPQYNFKPRDEEPRRVFREEVEKHYVVEDEGCYRCGIRCWKMLFEPRFEDGKRLPGQFLCKVDYEPLNMLGTNCGINDPAQIWGLIETCDDLGFDAISLGATISYVMDYNSRHADNPIAGGIQFGDAAGAKRLMERIARGEEPEIGKGVAHLSRMLGDEAYAYHCKGLELPAYLPSTNPGYPWAIAGGHMSMRTFLLLLFEGKTDLDYWVDAITQRGLYTVRDDMSGLCKFAGIGDPPVLESIRAVTGVELTEDELKAAVRRTFLRGYKAERLVGCTDEEYTVPEETFVPNPWVKLPHFVTPEFMAELRKRVNAVFDSEAQNL